MEEGGNTITANAVSSEDDTAGDSIIINAETTGDYLTLNSDTESGISPLEIVLSIEGTFGITEVLSITYTGPGTVDILAGGEDNKYNVRITTEGLYFFTAELEQEGMVFTDSIAVLVMNVQEMDGLLKAKWNGMKNALIDGDVQKALSYYHEIARAKYEAIYNFLGTDLQAKAQQMQDIELVFAEGNRAKYRINREHDVNGESVTITYYIYFVKDEDGLWKLEGY